MVGDSGDEIGALPAPAAHKLQFDLYTFAVESIEQIENERVVLPRLQRAHHQQHRPRRIIAIVGLDRGFQRAHRKYRGRGCIMATFSGQFDQLPPGVLGDAEEVRTMLEVRLQVALEAKRRCRFEPLRISDRRNVVNVRSGCHGVSLQVE